MLDNNLERTDKGNKLWTVLFVTLPLQRYYIPGISFLMFSDIAQISLMVAGLACNYQTKKNRDVYRAIIIYGFYVIVQAVFSAVYMPVYDVSTNLTTVMRLWIQIILIVYTSDLFFNKEFGISLYIKIACIHSLLIAGQLILFLLFGLRTSLLLPFLQAEAGYNNAAIIAARIFRPTGLFYEPAQTAHYCIPALVIVLFCVFDKNRYKTKHPLIYATIISVGLISSRSGAAIILMIFVWAVFGIVYFIRTKSVKSIAAIASIIAAGFVIRLSPIISASIERGTNITSSSGSTRIIRSFITWAQFPVFYKIFGIGYSNYGVYVKNAGFETAYDYIQDIAYSNAGGDILSGVGIIGFLLFLRVFYKLFKKHNITGKMIVLLLFLSLFYSGIVKGVYFPMYITLVFALNRYDDCYRY